MPTVYLKRQRVLLQYPEDPKEKVRKDSMLPVGEDAGQFVALDSASGGYPYSTDIESAHNFKTVEEANKYRRNGGFGFTVRVVEVTYEWQR